MVLAFSFYVLKWVLWLISKVVYWKRFVEKKKNLRHKGPTLDSVSLVLIFAPEQDNIFRLDGIT